MIRQFTTYPIGQSHLSISIPIAPDNLGIIHECPIMAEIVKIL